MKIEVNLWLQDALLNHLSDVVEERVRLKGFHSLAGRAVTIKTDVTQCRSTTFLSARWEISRWPGDYDPHAGCYEFTVQQVMRSFLGIEELPED